MEMCKEGMEEGSQAAGWGGGGVNLGGHRSSWKHALVTLNAKSRTRAFIDRPERRQGILGTKQGASLEAEGQCGVEMCASDG